MSGAITLLLIRVFMECTGKMLPFFFYLSLSRNLTRHLSRELIYWGSDTRVLHEFVVSCICVMRVPPIIFFSANFPGIINCVQNTTEVLELRTVHCHLLVSALRSVINEHCC